VDDQPSIAGLMSQLLGMRGYDVVTAANAEQAEAEVERQVPDLILSDVIMPGKSGYELCREFKDNPATRLIPFVLITGLTDSGDKLRGIEAGAGHGEAHADLDHLLGGGGARRQRDHGGRRECNHDWSAEHLMSPPPAHVQSGFRSFGIGNAP